MTQRDPILLDLPMPIRTPRLLIRPRQIGEGAIVAQAINESVETLKPWMPFVQWLQKPMTAEDSELKCREALGNFILRKDFTLSIYTPDGKTFLGSTGLHRAIWEVPSFHIGYWIHRDHERQGYATEAAHALTLYAFQVLKARRVELRCDALNLASLAVMKRLGYVQEGLFRGDSMNPNGELRDTIITARTNLEGLPPLDVRW
jgi:RimJ/RimL family protein N-acetyltransferase